MRSRRKCQESHGIDRLSFTIDSRVFQSDEFKGSQILMNPFSRTIRFTSAFSEWHSFSVLKLCLAPCILATSMNYLKDQVAMRKDIPALYTLQSC